MHRLANFRRRTTRLIVISLATGLFADELPSAQAAKPPPRDANDWVEPMRRVHARFKGQEGTFAHFGDSITVTMAFWTPLRYSQKNLSPAGKAAFGRVSSYMRPQCWREWKGPKFGNNGSMTIRWAHQNIGTWLKEHNPEVALIMFGTNDLNSVPIDEYEQKSREVVQRCLDNGTVVILSTIPPFSGRLDKSRAYAEVARKLAGELKVPLCDFFNEIVTRRPEDWDGKLAKFSAFKGYDVPTLISRDGVHPSNPKKYSGDYSAEALRSSGYALRSYLTLLAYADVIDRVLEPSTKGAAAEPATKKIPILLDTDIGTDVDDAFALALALASPELDLRGVTTVAGGAEDRAWMACRMLSLVGRGEVPVAWGREPQPDFGVNWQIQYRRHPAAVFNRTSKPLKTPAADFLYEKLKAEPGKLTLVAVGPLTNIARLLKEHPDAKPWIKRIVIMGGSVRVGYNAKPPIVPEWNIRSDAAAAQTVFTAGVPLVVAPLDATTMLKLQTPRREKIFASCTPLAYQLKNLYQLWEQATPTLYDPVAVTLVFSERFCTMEPLRLEVDEKGVTRTVEGKPNARVATSVRGDEFLEWYTNRLAAHGETMVPKPPGNVSSLVPRGGLPRRVHAIEDYETDIEKRWWMCGKLEKKDVPQGSQRASRGVITQDFDGRMGDTRTAYTAVIFNPVPGPPMGPHTRLSFRYRLSGTDTIRVQLYSLSNGYHRYLAVKGLPQDKWQSATVDMTAMRRPDGSGGPLAADERIDDIQFYIDPRAELLIDDVVLYDAAPDETRPFPQRIHFTGWFDTGRQGREWPGDFEIVKHQPPRTWKAARSVEHAKTGKPWIRVHLRGRRPLGERTRLRFNCRLSKPGPLRVALIDSKSERALEVRFERLAGGAWREQFVNFQPESNKPPLEHADELRFFPPEGAEMLLDDVLLYEPGEL